MDKILAGLYSYNEFFAIVNKWRERYAVNELAVLPRIEDLLYIENLRIIHLERGIELEEIA